MARLGKLSRDRLGVNCLILLDKIKTFAERKLEMKTP